MKELERRFLEDVEKCTKEGDSDKRLAKLFSIAVDEEMSLYKNHV